GARPRCGSTSPWARYTDQPPTSVTGWCAGSPPRAASRFPALGTARFRTRCPADAFGSAPRSDRALPRASARGESRCDPILGLGERGEDVRPRSAAAEEPLRLRIDLARVPSDCGVIEDHEHPARVVPEPERHLDQRVRAQREIEIGLRLGGVRCALRLVGIAEIEDEQRGILLDALLSSRSSLVPILYDRVEEQSSRDAARDQ